MALKALKPCGHPNCPALVKEGRCEKHRQQIDRQRYEEKVTDPIWQMYQHPRWKKFRRWFFRLNPFCQLIVNGEQCHNEATLIHHRKAVRTHLELFLVASNCVGLCAAHHHHGEGDRGDERYIKTEEGMWGIGDDA